MHPEFHLSPEEIELVENSEWLLTKNRIIGKIYGLMGMMSTQYSGILEQYKEYIPEEITAVSPKIYRGEQYHQLPYVMMDHPRYFSKENAFAVRSFFWWGNHFSIHLLLGGKYREYYEPFIRKHIEEGSLDQWYLGVSAEPWEHHFDMNNYQKISGMKGRPLLFPNGNYLKLGKWHPLADWKAAVPFYLHSYHQLMEAIV